MSTANDIGTLAHELEQMALGKGYFGNALYAARDVPGVTYDDKILLSRWLRGVQRGADQIALQKLSVKIRKIGESK